MNYIEAYPSLITFSLVSGLYFPTYTYIAVFLYLIARIAYSVGYVKGANYRIFGGILQSLITISLIILSFISFIYLLQSEP